MPIYEYDCTACGDAATLFFRSFAAAAAEVEPLRCARCGGPLRRRMSRPAPVRSGTGQPAPAADALDAEDPATLAGLLRHAGAVAGERLDGEMGEIVERLEAGETPSQVGAGLAEPSAPAAPPPPPAPSTVPRP